MPPSDICTEARRAAAPTGTGATEGSVPSGQGRSRRSRPPGRAVRGGDRPCSASPRFPPLCGRGGDTRRDGRGPLFAVRAPSRVDVRPEFVSVFDGPTKAPSCADLRTGTGAVPARRNAPAKGTGRRRPGRIHHTPWTEGGQSRNEPGGPRDRYARLPRPRGGAPGRRPPIRSRSNFRLPPPIEGTVGGACCGARTTRGDGAHRDAGTPRGDRGKTRVGGPLSSEGGVQA
jgi:hypothetical protein